MVDVTVETDHKLLESILKKPLYQAPIRLQKMIMTIQRYNIKVRYRPGKELVIADTLSRAPNNSRKTQSTIIMKIMKSTPFSRSLSANTNYNKYKKKQSRTKISKFYNST